MGEKRTGGAIGGRLDRANIDSAKEAARTKYGKALDSLPARQRALLAERLADCPQLLAVAARITEIEDRAIVANCGGGMREQRRPLTGTERVAIDRLREALAKGLALAE